MANRFPLVIDTQDDNTLKELPAGDNLNLQNSGIINAQSIQVDGTITTSSITIGGSTLTDVAFTADYNDLINKPNLFSGDYEDLINKPDIPDITRELADVDDVEPSDQNILIYNAPNGVYEPRLVTWSDIDNKPQNVSYFNNDLDYVTQNELSVLDGGDASGSI